jgi:hypothetical protein
MGCLSVCSFSAALRPVSASPNEASALFVPPQSLKHPHAFKNATVINYGDPLSCSFPSVFTFFYIRPEQVPSACSSAVSVPHTTAIWQTDPEVMSMPSPLLLFSVSRCSCLRTVFVRYLFRISAGPMFLLYFLGLFRLLTTSYKSSSTHHPRPSPPCHSMLCKVCS